MQESRPGRLRPSMCPGDKLFIHQSHHYGRSHRRAAGNHLKHGHPDQGKISMAKKTEKTNAARLLDKAKIAYGLIPYEFDENDLAARHVADSLGQDIARVFKTLVLHGDRTGHIVCVIPGNGEVDLKALAKVSGNKKVEMIAMKDLLGVTGYIRGGCSPVGMKKRFPTYFHSTATDFETIFVSAGIRGLQLEIAPSDLIGFTGGTVADVASF